MADVSPYNNLRSIAVSVVPPGYITNRAYTSEGQLEYLGWAPRGTANSDSSWTILKKTYTSNQETAERIAVNAVWNDKESLSYS